MIPALVVVGFIWLAIHNHRNPEPRHPWWETWERMKEKS